MNPATTEVAMSDEEINDAVISEVRIMLACTRGLDATIKSRLVQASSGPLTKLVENYARTFAPQPVVTMQRSQALSTETPCKLKLIQEVALTLAGATDRGLAIASTEAQVVTTVDFSSQMSILLPAVRRRMATEGIPVLKTVAIGARGVSDPIVADAVSYAESSFERTVDVSVDDERSFEWFPNHQLRCIRRNDDADPIRWVVELDDLDRDPIEVSGAVARHLMG